MVNFKDLIATVELSILVPSSDEFLYFKQDSCCYKIRNTKENLENFIKRLKKPMRAEIGSPTRYRGDSATNVIKRFIKEGEFENALEALDLTGLDYGIGKGERNKPILYFPVEITIMWNRSVFITKEDAIIDVLSGLRIGEKGIVLTPEQEAILAAAPNNQAELKQILMGNNK